MFEAMESIVSGNGVHTSLLRESIDLIDRLVDPMDAYRDPVDGELWLPIIGNTGTHKNRPALDRAGFANDQELEIARNYCRVLSERNEYVIAASENRISYVVGQGHTYKFIFRAHVTPESPEYARWMPQMPAVQKWLEDWIYVNKWQKRQAECVRRRDRDGETFFRYFMDSEGTMRVRFVEPWQVKQPDKPEPNDEFGIRTDKEDAEDVEGYWIDGELVDADEVQHRKANVDLNVRRGMMTFWPVRRVLYQIDEIAVFLAHLCKVRAAFAAVRKMEGATNAQASSFVGGKADYTSINMTTGETRRFEKVRPGSIRTVNERMFYEFPASNIGATDYEIAINLLLRSVASRLCMPVWMLTSNVADMAAYTASLVAESHSVRMFERLQAEQEEDDLHVLWRAVDAAIKAGKLPEGVDESLDIQVGKPTVAIRDKLQEAQVRQVDMGAGILSPQTASADAGYEYEEEQTNIEAHLEKTGGLASPVDLLAGGGDADQSY